MSKGSLQIDLLGTSFAIQADEKPEYLSALYSHYKQMLSRVEQTSGLRDSLKIAILAGILVSDELYKEKMKRSDIGSLDLSTAEKITLDLISKIDQVIG
jgi:cell division protein ZapA